MRVFIKIKTKNMKKIKNILIYLISLYGLFKTKLKSWLGLDLRPSAKFFKEYFKDRPLIGVEIGVFRGDNAKRLLRNLNIQKLYLIDPYGKLYVEKNDIVSTMEADSEYSEFLEKEPGFNGIVYDFEKAHKFAENNLRNFRDKVQFIKKKSENAVSEIPDGIDFIYIDGNHSYEYVKRDIELYFPKIKKGGVISGHDFSGEYYGVAKAAIEFSEEKKLKLCGINYDWWIIKE